MILLDTCAYLWFISDPGALSPGARAVLEQREEALLSLASIWEVAVKVQIGKLSLDLPVGEWVRKSLLHPKLRLMSLTPTTVVLSTQLPGEFHEGPFDRAIVAEAIRGGHSIMTRDRRILAYTGARSIPC